MPLAARFANFAFPPWTEACWKLAVMAAATAAVSLLTAPFLGVFHLVLVFAVLWLFLWKWFDADAFGAVVVTLLVVVVNFGLSMVVLAALAA